MKNDCNVDTKKVYSKVEDFLKDDDFIKYVLDDAPEMAFHWDKLLKDLKRPRMYYWFLMKQWK